MTATDGNGVCADQPGAYCSSGNRPPHTTGTPCREAKTQAADIRRKGQLGKVRVRES